jgi:hypothetical protein
MHTLLPIFCFTLSVGLAAAEITRKEEIRATTPAEDSKPNSEKVPDAYALDGQFDRIVVVRFKYQTDLLSALEGVVREQKSRRAVQQPACLGEVVAPIRVSALGEQEGLQLPFLCKK